MPISPPDRRCIVGDSGDITLPPDLRRRFGIEAGSSLLVEEPPDGILIRPVAPPAESYTPERIAEFLLNNAMDADDYAAALAESRRLGVDPAAVPHEPPRSG